MAQRVFSLADVPEDEADDVRRLLRASGIEFFETPSTLWIFPGALWVGNDEEFARARGLIDAYQGERAARVRNELLQSPPTSAWRERPLQVLLVILAVLGALALSALPYFLLTG